MLDQDCFDQTKSWQSNWTFLRRREERLIRMTLRVGGEIEGAVAGQDDGESTEFEESGSNSHDNDYEPTFEWTFR